MPFALTDRVDTPAWYMPLFSLVTEACKTASNLAFVFNPGGTGFDTETFQVGAWSLSFCCVFVFSVVCFVFPDGSPIALCLF